MSDVNLDTLSLLRLLKPVPDLLVLGCGRRVRQLPPELASQLHQMGVRVDAMDTVGIGFLPFSSSCCFSTSLKRSMGWDFIISSTTVVPKQLLWAEGLGMFEF